MGSKIHHYLTHNHYFWIVVMSQYRFAQPVTFVNKKFQTMCTFFRYYVTQFARAIPVPVLRSVFAVPIVPKNDFIRFFFYLRFNGNYNFYFKTADLSSRNIFEILTWPNEGVACWKCAAADSLIRDTWIITKELRNTTVYISNLAWKLSSTQYR